MDRIVRRAPASGRCLDIGCGHGLFVYYLAAGSGSRSILGVDVSSDKITEACKAEFPSGQVRFECQPHTEVHEADFDLISLIDVLYLIPPDEQARLLRWCHAHLAPAGILIVKEVDDRPRWKYWINYAEETLAVRVLGITLGQRLYFRPPAAIVKDLTASGFSVDVEPIHRGYAHPHVLYVCRKSAT